MRLSSAGPETEPKGRIRSGKPRTIGEKLLHRIPAYTNFELVSW